MWGCRKGHLGAVRSLLLKNANVNTASSVSVAMVAWHLSLLFLLSLEMNGQQATPIKVPVTSNTIL